MHVDAPAELEQVGEGPIGVTLRHHRLNGRLAHPLDGAQTIDNLVIFSSGKVVLTQVNVGRLHIQVHVMALIDQGHHLVGVIHVRR